MYIANKVGPRILPCGIPLVTLDLFEQDIPTFTHCNQLDKKQVIHLWIYCLFHYIIILQPIFYVRPDQRLFKVKMNNVIWINIIKHVTQIFNNMQQLSDASSMFTKTMLTITM